MALASSVHSRELARGPAGGAVAPLRGEDDQGHAGFLPVASRGTFALCACLYLVVGGCLVAHGSVVPEAVSRTARAYVALWGRDPHLSAIGFDQSPLTTLVQLPFTALALQWPWLAGAGVIALVQSALFMAGSVVQLHRLVRASSASPWVPAVLSAIFALHPEVVLAGADGMAEAALVYFTLTAAVHLMRWVRAAGTTSLAGCAMALALGYLSHADGAGALVAAVPVVAVTAWRRTPGPRAVRCQQVLADALVLVIPFVVAVLCWALAAWVINGTVAPALAEFSLGPSPMPGVPASAGGGSGRALLAAGQSLVLAPLGPVLLLAAIISLLWGRRFWLLAPLLVLGGTYLSCLGLLLSGHSFGGPRLAIELVPLAVVSAGVAVPASAGSAARAGLRRLGTAMVIAVAAASVPVSAYDLVSGVHASDTQASEEADLVLPVLAPSTATSLQRQALLRGYQDRALAAWLDRQRLPAGAAVIDGADGFGVELESRRPRQFTVSTDRDFPSRMARPAASGVRYLVTRMPSRGEQPDAVRSAYPQIDTDPRFHLAWTAADPGDLPRWQVYTPTADTLTAGTPTPDQVNCDRAATCGAPDLQTSRGARRGSAPDVGVPFNRRPARPPRRRR